MPTVQAQGTEPSQSESAGSGDVLGAIHHLPPEVLSKIFLLVLPTDRELHKESHMRPNRRTRLINPFLLCSICSMWRTLAIATPQLWRRVFIYIPPPGPLITYDIACSKADDLAQWIQRSGSLHLTLYITYGAYGNASLLEATGPMAPIVDLLTRYAARWEAFYLQSPVYRGRGRKATPELFCLGGWSSLRRVSLHEVLCVTQNTKTTIPWAQLTHLEINLDVFFNMTVNALRECRKLTWLSIRVFSQIPQLSGPSLILPDLVTFHLTTYDVVPVMDLICLPSLREMFISRLVTDEDDVESLLGFLTRSACVLDKLEIGGMLFCGRDLVRVLAHQCCNSLTSLTISGRSRLRPAIYNYIGGELFERLSLYHDKPLCPHLRLLILERHWLRHASSVALLGMVKSRIEFPAGDGRFHFLSLEVEKFAHEQELEEIIKRSGMDYTLRRSEPENFVTACKIWLDGRSFEMYFSDSIQLEW